MNPSDLYHQHGVREQVCTRAEYRSKTIVLNIPMQIDINSIARATNAAHYEYLTTVRKRTEEIQLDHELWRKAVEEFRQAF